MCERPVIPYSPRAACRFSSPLLKWRTSTRRLIRIMRRNCLALSKPIIGRRRLVRTASRSDRIEHKREYDADRKIDPERVECRVAGHGETVHCNGKSSVLEA